MLQLFVRDGGVGHRPRARGKAVVRGVGRGWSGGRGTFFITVHDLLWV